MIEPSLFGTTPNVHKCPTCDGTGQISGQRMKELMERPGKSRHDSGTTSRVAGTTPRKETQRGRVLSYLGESGGSTAYEAARAFGMSPNQVAARLGELHEDTWVEYQRDDTGRIVERETTPGNTAMVHQLTPAGRLVESKL